MFFTLRKIEEKYISFFEKLQNGNLYHQLLKLTSLKPTTVQAKNRAPPLTAPLPQFLC